MSENLIIRNSDFPIAEFSDSLIYNSHVVIYTKRGDKGETSLFDKDSSQRVRVSKTSRIVHALGALDELNSFIGIAITFCEDPAFVSQLKEVQKNLLTIGTITAGSGLKFAKSNTTKLEREIDNWEGSLPVLRNFVYPGGSKFSAHIHYARAIARRAERRMVALSEIQKVNENILTYMNRLSDYLFMLARSANTRSGLGDEVWVGRKK